MTSTSINSVEANILETIYKSVQEQTKPVEKLIVKGDKNIFEQLKKTQDLKDKESIDVFLKKHDLKVLEIKQKEKDPGFTIRNCYLIGYIPRRIGLFGKAENISNKV